MKTIMEKVLITKGNERRSVTPKAAKIAVNLMGWSEVITMKAPAEVGKRTKPIIIVADNAIPLKTAKAEYPGDEIKPEIIKPADSGAQVAEPVAEVTEKKTRKSPVKSKSKK